MNTKPITCLKSFLSHNKRFSRKATAKTNTIHTQMDPSTDPLLLQQQRYCYNTKLRWNPQVQDYFVHAYGSLHFSRISSSLTRPSSYSCIRVNTLKSNADDVIQKLHSVLKNGKESLGNDVVRCLIPGLEYVLFVKGSGPNSVDYGCSQNAPPPKEVVVSRKCAEAVLRGAQVFVPGIMACSAHVEKGDTVAVAVAVEQRVPDGGWALGITRGTILQGLPTDIYYFERNGLYIGQGTTTMSRAGLFRASEGIAVSMHNRVYNLPSLHNVLEGEIFLQNLPSIITAHALDPKKGERILDMCAAPGGKTTAIAILMKDEGEIIAVDRSHNKVLEIQKLASEMGLNCISTYKLDSLKSVRRRDELIVTTETTVSCALKSCNDKVPSTMEVLGTDKFVERNVSNGTENETTQASKAATRKTTQNLKNGPGRNQSLGGRVEKSKGFDPKTFDRVLLDAPCSALGLRPRLFAAEETIESLRNHAKYQRRMFDQAVQLVRPGGVIVYSTCTINPGENEALVRYALDTYKFLSLAPQNPRVGGPGLIGSFKFPDGYVEEWLRPGEEDLVQRFDPSSTHDTIGFFIAKFNVGSIAGV